MAISRKPQPEHVQAPVVQRIRIRYAKRGPLRFTSHRDFARAFERAIRRAGVPIAYSQGFSPHPKVSYASAAPTGVASEAEYLEIGLQTVVDPEWVREALDKALSAGLDVVSAVVAAPGSSLADQIDVSRWRVELPGADPDQLSTAVSKFTAAPEVIVKRLAKQGWREFDCRSAVTSVDVGADPLPGAEGPLSCAILDLVVRKVTPSVRPDDVLSGLRVIAEFEPPVPPRVTRLAQGRLTAQGEILDPLSAESDEAKIGHPFD